MSATRYAAIAFTVAVLGVPAVTAAKMTLAAGADVLARAVVNQSFDALQKIPVPTTELRTALAPRRADRQTVPVREVRSETVTVGATAQNVTSLFRVPARFAMN